VRGAGLDAADAWRTGYRHARGAALPHGRHRGAKRLARNDGAFPRRFPAVRTQAPSQCALRGLWARKPLPFEALVQLMRCNSATWEQMGAEGMGARSAVTTEGTGCNSEIAKAQVLSLPLSLPLSLSLSLSLSVVPGDEWLAVVSPHERARACWLLDRDGGLRCTQWRVGQESRRRGFLVSYPCSLRERVRAARSPSCTQVRATATATATEHRDAKT
jgi:hypothetical protein